MKRKRIRKEKILVGCSNANRFAQFKKDSNGIKIKTKNNDRHSKVLQ